MSASCTRLRAFGRLAWHQRAAVLDAWHGRAGWGATSTPSLGNILRAYSSLPSHSELGMPSLSPTMTQGNIIRWYVKEGDEIAAGTVLADIETDKATLAFENQEDGFIAKILVAEGTKDIPVGTPVAIIVEEAEDVAAFANYAPAAAAGAATQPAAAAPAEPAAAAVPSASKPAASGPANFRLGPAARYALQETGLTVEDITPTGPNNIITKDDVLTAAAGEAKPKPKAAAAAPAAPQPAKAAAPAAPKPAAAAAAPSPPPPPGATYTDAPTSQVRRIIAQRLLGSKQSIPSHYLSTTVPLGPVQDLRRALASQGTKVSVNDCVVRAAALALADVPAANCYWDEAKGEAVAQAGVDVAVAVATPTGLLTPVVFGADGKGLVAINKEVADLAARARANKLKPEEFTGGSMSISNLGMFGLTSFSAIINPPQSVIMAVGGAQAEVTLGPDGHPVSAPIMSITLSADQRVVDGEVAAALLEAFNRYFSNPATMMLG